MSRETCIKCEIMFLETLKNNTDIEDVLDGTLEDIGLDNQICLKCLYRILKRYITN